jgi:hypothetical protein
MVRRGSVAMEKMRPGEKERKTTLSDIPEVKSKCSQIQYIRCFWTLLKLGSAKLFLARYF